MVIKPYEERITLSHWSLKVHCRTFTSLYKLSTTPLNVNTTEKRGPDSKLYS